MTTRGVVENKLCAELPTPSRQFDVFVLCLRTTNQQRPPTQPPPTPPRRHDGPTRARPWYRAPPAAVPAPVASAADGTAPAPPAVSPGDPRAVRRGSRRRLPPGRRLLCAALVFRHGPSAGGGRIVHECGGGAAKPIPAVEQRRRDRLPATDAGTRPATETRGGPATEPANGAHPGGVQGGAAGEQRRDRGGAIFCHVVQGATRHRCRCWLVAAVRVRPVAK